jgi:histidyl-tRNA synthetase
MPAVGGAYVLVVRLSTPISINIRGKTWTLAPGKYLYCGSAKGPGGLKRRLARHMRQTKSLHWHVDRLTQAGTVLGAFIFRQGDECGLVGALSHLPIAAEGFGSSDCRSCRSHLLLWPRGTRLYCRD